MKMMAFVTRHSPTDQQRQLAKEQGYDLVWVGDRDAFTINPLEFEKYDAVAVVHAASAMRLLTSGFVVGIFENANRAPEGEKPTFEAVALHIYGTK